MKYSYLVVALIISVVILIVAFQNVVTMAVLNVFLQSINTTLTLPIILIAFFGMIAGVFYTLFFQDSFSLRNQDSDIDNFDDDKF